MIEKIKKKFIKYNMYILFVIISLISLFIVSCSQPQKQIVVKYKYIEKPIPTLQTIKTTELNLSKEKPLKLHIKIKKSEIFKGD